MNVIVESYRFSRHFISGLQTDLKQLEGMALVDLDAKPQVIWFYPENELPEDIQERINVLFQVREKWTLEEIHPFVE